MDCLACCGTVGYVVPRLRVVESANSVQCSVRWIRVLCRTMKRTWRFLDVARLKNGYCYLEQFYPRDGSHWFPLCLCLGIVGVGVGGLVVTVSEQCPKFPCESFVVGWSIVAAP